MSSTPNSAHSPLPLANAGSFAPNGSSTKHTPVLASHRRKDSRNDSLDGIEVAQHGPAVRFSRLRTGLPRPQVVMNAGLYGTMGFAVASFNVCTPELKNRLQASDWALSTVFLASSLGSAATLFRLSSDLHGKLGPRLCTAVSTAGVGTTLALVGWNTHWPLAALIQTFSGASIGVMGVSIGCTSMVLDRTSAVMGSTEAMYSLGTLLGALSTEAALSDGIPMPRALTAVGAAVVLVSVLSYALTSAEGTVRAPAQRQKADPAIVWLSLVSACSNLAEGGISKWLSVYLADNLHASPALARGGYTVVTATAITGRLVADRVWPEASVPPLACIGGLVSSIALGLGLWRNDIPSVMLGAAVAMLSLCNFSPAVKRQVKRLYPEEQWPAATSWTSGSKNLGSITGSPIIGFLASRYGLRAGMSVIVAEGLLKAAMAPALSAAFQQHRNAQSEEEVELEGLLAPSGSVA